jgi:hypothetical protein
MNVRRRTELGLTDDFDERERAASICAGEFHGEFVGEQPDRFSAVRRDVHEDLLGTIST